MARRRSRFLEHFRQVLAQYEARAAVVAPEVDNDALSDTRVEATREFG